MTFDEAMDRTVNVDVDADAFIAVDANRRIAEIAGD